jgi:hypothetical protein
LEGGPVPRFEIDPPVIYAGEVVVFDASSSQSTETIVSYAWEFGDGKTAYGQQVMYTYPAPGSYGVTLRVVDSAGNSAQVNREIVVYLRSGTEIFFEDFSTGATSLAAWALDPAWASAAESTVENLGGLHGFVLHIDSGTDRWHRRNIPLHIPPLRVGQRLAFTCQVMTAQTQDGYTFSIFPARKTLETVAGSLPYFVFTPQGGGAAVREPDGSGNEVSHTLFFKPGVFMWYTCKFIFSPGKYRFYVNDVLYASGSIRERFTAETQWLILLGDESHTEACDTYFDEIRAWIEE